MATCAPLALLAALSPAALRGGSYARPAPRHAALRAGPAADLIRHRTGCTVDEAKRAEARLGGRTVSPTRCSEVCEGLQRQLGLDNDEIKKIVLSRPAILGLDFESSLAPALDGLQGRVGLSKEELRRVVIRLPTLLGYNFHSNVNPKITALQSFLGLSDEELKRVLISSPSVRAPRTMGHAAGDLTSSSRPQLTRCIQSPSRSWASASRRISRRSSPSFVVSAVAAFGSGAKRVLWIRRVGGVWFGVVFA